jgi:hypothetical protein
MKKLMLRTGAMSFIAVGASLVALPSWAAWSRCISDGGFHPTEKWSSCRITTTRNDMTGDLTFGILGTCGARKVRKGDYCAPQDGSIKCESLPDKDVPVHRSEGVCKIAKPIYDPELGDFITIFGDEFIVEPNQEYPNFYTDCRNDEDFFESSNETAPIGQCKEVTST